MSSKIFIPMQFRMLIGIMFLFFGGYFFGIFNILYLNNSNLPNSVFLFVIFGVVFMFVGMSFLLHREELLSQIINKSEMEK